MDFMDNVNLILQNKIFKDALMKNMECEEHRKFCCHDLTHFLDVARIAYILNLENKFNLKKEVIYAAAILHDIGRWMEYKEGIPHHIASVRLASTILSQCNFKEDDTSQIIESISQHRDNNIKRSKLSEIIYLGDKLSRNCFYCSSYGECKWSEEKKNNRLKY